MAGQVIELSHKLRILVADESLSARESLHGNLKRLGFSAIFLAFDAHSAMASIRHEKIDLALVDKELPGLPGLELLCEIRENPAFHGMPFLLLGAEATREEIMLAGEYNVDGFLRKPYSLKEISKRITACMANYSSDASIERRFDAARNELMAGRVEASLTLYRSILDTHPDSVRARVGLGRCLRKLRKFDDALDILNEALAQSEAAVHAWHELGLLHLDWDSKEQAMYCFLQAIHMSPRNPIRYEEVANILLGEGRYEDAAALLTHAIKRNLSYPVLYEQLGKAFFHMGRHDKALRFLSEAVKRAPNDPSFLNTIGVCLKQMKRFDEALRHYNMALKLKPKDPRILFNKALCYVDMGEKERAREVLTRIITLHPHYHRAQKKLEELGKGEKASA